MEKEREFLDKEETVPLEVNQPDDLLEEHSVEESELEDILLVSPEEYFPDCGCGLVESCVTEDCLLHEDAHREEGDESVSEEASEEYAKETVDEEKHKDVDLGKDNSTERTEAESESDSSSSYSESYFLSVLGLKTTNTLPDEHGDEDEDEDDATCFVATAAYQNCSHPNVTFLREFRNTTLSRYLAGRLFIRFYWMIGPKMAVHVTRSPRLAAGSRGVIGLIVYILKLFR